MFDSTFIFLTGGLLFLLGLIIGVIYLLYAEHTVHELEYARIMYFPPHSSGYDYAEDFLYKIEKAKQFSYYAFFFSGFGLILMILSRSKRKKVELNTTESN